MSNRCSVRKSLYGVYGIAYNSQGKIVNRHNLQHAVSRDIGYDV